MDDERFLSFEEPIKELAQKLSALRTAAVDSPALIKEISNLEKENKKLTKKRLYKRRRSARTKKGGFFGWFKKKSSDENAAPPQPSPPAPAPARPTPNDDASPPMPLDDNSIIPPWAPARPPPPISAKTRQQRLERRTRSGL